jgi:uncharacterized membrane protein YccC
MKQLISQLNQFPGRYGAEIRFTLRITVAALITYAIVLALEIPQGFWAVITAVLVVQANLGGSLKFAADRFIGTLSGAVVGVIAMMLIAHTSPLTQAASMVIALLPLGFIAALNQSMRIAPLTALIVMLVATHSDPISSAIERIAGIVIGDVVGVLVALLFLPARASNQLTDATGELLAGLAALADLLRRGLAGEQIGNDIHRQHESLRKTLKKIDDYADAARRERHHHLWSGPEPEPLVRTVNRLRNDLITLGRVANGMAADQRTIPIPSLAQAVDAVMVAGRDFLTEAGHRIKEGGIGPSLEAFAAALDLLKAERASIRRGPRAGEIDRETAATLSVLVFSFEQFEKDAADLAARVNEMAGPVAKTDGRT